MIRRTVSIFLLFAVFLSAGCSAKIARYGYTLEDIQKNNNASDFFIPIKKNFVYNKDEVEILGEIKAGDTGFSTDCNEGHVLNIFRQEACALKADLINIIYERNTDMLSSCYRAKAQFLRFKNREKVKNL